MDILIYFAKIGIVSYILARALTYRLREKCNDLLLEASTNKLREMERYNDYETEIILLNQALRNKDQEIDSIHREKMTWKKLVDKYEKNLYGETYEY